MEDIEDILLQMEEEINNGKKSLFGNGVTVDPNVMFSLVDKIRNNLPDMIREAKYIIASGEKRKADETVKAQGIIAAAQQRAEEILGEHALIKQAEREAEAIRSQANDYRTRIISEVKADIDTLLSDTEHTLTESLNLIKSAKSSNRR